MAIMGWMGEATKPLREGFLTALGLEQGLAYQPWVRARLEKSLRLIAQTLLPEGGAFPYSAEDTGVVEYLLKRFEKLDEEKRNLIVATVLGYEYIFPVIFRRGLRFSTMSAEAREALMRDMEYTDIYIVRMLSTMLRVFLCMAYLADERVLAEMEFFKNYPYPGDPRNIEIRKDFSQGSSSKEARAASALDTAVTEEGGQEAAKEAASSKGTQEAKAEKASSGKKKKSEKESVERGGQHLLVEGA